MKDRKNFDAYMKHLELLDLELSLRVLWVRIKIAWWEFQLKLLALFD